MTFAQLDRRGAYRELAERLERELASDAASGDPYRGGGGDDVEQAERWHELGRAQWLLARYPEAMRSLGRAIELRERMLGPSDPRTVDSWERMAALQHAQLDDAARPLFERVVAARRAMHGVEHPATAIALRNFGAYLRDVGGAGARTMLEQACALLTATGGPEHAAALKARAFEQLRWGPPRDWQTLALAEQALEATVRCHPADHPFVAGALLLVGHGELAVGRLRPARRAYQAAGDILFRCYGGAHPLLDVALAGLAAEWLPEAEPDEGTEPQTAPVTPSPPTPPAPAVRKQRKKRRRR